MDAKTYVKNVLVTEARDFSPVQARLMDIRNIRLIHASAGIASEIAELIELSQKSFDGLDRVNLMEECGDVLWYIGIAADTLDAVDEILFQYSYEAPFIGDDLTLSENVFSTAAYLSKLSGEFADLAIKKTVFYGKKVEDAMLKKLLTDIHANVALLLQSAGYKIEDSRERNIAKLKARYGEKFTEAAALERNLEAERTILENK